MSLSAVVVMFLAFMLCVVANEQLVEFLDRMETDKRLAFRTYKQLLRMNYKKDPNLIESWMRHHKKQYSDELLLARLLVDALVNEDTPKAAARPAKGVFTRWLSQRPRVLQIDGLLTETECKSIIELGKPLVQPWEQEFTRGRRSEGAFLPWGPGPAPRGRPCAALEIATGPRRAPHAPTVYCPWALHAPP